MHLNEVAGPKLSMLVGDEAAPALAGAGVGIASGLPHDPLGCALADLDAQLEHLAANSFGPPCPIFKCDASDTDSAPH